MVEVGGEMAMAAVAGVRWSVFACVSVCGAVVAAPPVKPLVS